MSFQTTIIQVISETFISTVGNLAQSIFYILAIYLGFRYLGKMISKGIEKIVKKMPEWLEQYYKGQLKLRTLDNVIERKKVYE
jgi:hypothetical protein